MVISSKDFLGKVCMLLFSILLASLLIGCNPEEYVHDDELVINMHNNAYSEAIADSFVGNLSEYHSFFGTWRLEKVAIRRQHIGEIGRPIYSDMPNAKDFLGQEMEFSDDFVRLGERRLSNPEYFVRQWIEEWTFFGHEIVWTPGYWDTPDELLDYFRHQGIHIGIESNYRDTILFEQILISYPYYTEMRWMGTLLDPELYMHNMALNPLFQSIIVLNDDYILIGSTCLVLARRIE